MCWHRNPECKPDTFMYINETDTHQSESDGASKEFVSQSSVICGHHLALAALALETIGKWTEESQLLAWCPSAGKPTWATAWLPTRTTWPRSFEDLLQTVYTTKNTLTRGVFPRLFESWLGCKKSFPKPCGCCTLTWGVVLLGSKKVTDLEMPWFAMICKGWLRSNWNCLGSSRRLRSWFSSVSC